MFDGVAIRVHSVNVDAGDSRVVWVICQKIHKIHVSKYVVADGDDPMHDNVSVRMRRLHACEVFSERRRAVSNQWVVLNVIGSKKLGGALFCFVFVDHHLIERQNIVDVADSLVIARINENDACFRLKCHFNLSSSQGAYSKPTMWRRIAFCSASDFSRTSRRTSSASAPTAPLLGAGTCSESSITRLAAETESRPLLCILFMVVAKVSKAFPYNSRCSAVIWSATRLRAAAVFAGPPVLMLPATARTTSTPKGFNSAR